MALMMNKAVFLDKDGTLVENVPYNIDPARIKIYLDVPDALRRLKEHGFRLILVTNQAGVAHGYFREKDLWQSNDALLEKFRKYGIRLDGLYYCPHHYNGVVPEFTVDCECRKPKPGMLFMAAAELRITLAESWMIGDILHDVEAGNRAACRTILIDNGNETEWIVNSVRTPFYKVKSMSEAADRILDHEKMRKEMEYRRYV
ncbi:MAG: D-glycero-alpha-D-manno-heptose-1,7-bisphosphate 7-phosphatase [Cytophagaceae bacterium]